MSNAFQLILDAVRGIVMLPSSVTSLLPQVISPASRKGAITPPPRRDMEAFVRECQALFEGPLKSQQLMAMSAQLQAQYKEKLATSRACMLPSYTYALPTGDEQGMYLSMDLGGSKFRIALVSLRGQGVAAPGTEMEIVKMRTIMIDNDVRALQGTEFFDWMAGLIQEVLDEAESQSIHKGQTLGMGLAWSFPIEQTSMTSGLLLEMGKGFKASVGILGKDIGELLTNACQKKNLDVRMNAVINDSSATLLSCAYKDDATRFALILGTGFNAAVMLPVGAIASHKYGDRPKSWFDVAKYVLVNTELSMFGKGVLPTTRWDDFINFTHEHPDYQPFEYLLGGRYLGELVRLLLVEAIQSIGLFSGQIPQGLEKRYSLEAGTMAILDSDDTPNLTSSREILNKLHPLQIPASVQDLFYVQQLCRFVSHRAAAYLATGIHALWELRCSSEGIAAGDAPRVTFGCNGSVIEMYPQFRTITQKYLDELTTLSGNVPRCIALEPAYESAIYGAAVAVACVE